MTGKDLQSIRIELGLTQREFAKLLGYECQTISAMERGREEISISFEKHVLAEKKLRDLLALLEKPWSRI
jgi:transcriptional regulator with XRE-family HTH domain